MVIYLVYPVNMVIFHSYVSLPEAIYDESWALTPCHTLSMSVPDLAVKDVMG